MLTTIASTLIVLWLIGFIGFNVLGNFIHLLLIIAIIVLLLHVTRGERL